MAGLNLEPVAPDLEISAGGSALDRIRGLYKAAEKRVDLLVLQIPRNGEMRIRYKAIDPDEVATDKPRAPRETNQDLLIAACDAIMVRGDNDQWEPLTVGGENVRFDEVLADVVGVPGLEQGGTARQVVHKVFSTAPVADLAIANHAMAISDWFAGEGGVDEDHLLGES